jgi:hypothetical protein
LLQSTRFVDQQSLLIAAINMMHLLPDGAGARRESVNHRDLQRRFVSPWVAVVERIGQSSDQKKVAPDLVAKK